MQRNPEFRATPSRSSAIALRRQAGPGHAKMEGVETDTTQLVGRQVSRPWRHKDKIRLENAFGPVWQIKIQYDTSTDTMIYIIIDSARYQTSMYTFKGHR